MQLAINGCVRFRFKAQVSFFCRLTCKNLVIFELESLPAEIETLETELEVMQEQVNDPDFFKQDSDVTAKALAKLADKEELLSQRYARWDELESMLEDNQQ